MSIDIKSMKSKFWIYVFRTETNNAGNLMLTRICKVKIAGRISTVYLFLRSFFWSWSIQAAVLNQASNFETKQTLSHGTWYVYTRIQNVFL